MISMSLYDIIQNILDVSKNHNLVREVGEGDIYKYLNSSEHQYPCVFLTVSSINDDLNLRNVNCTLFYVDRLTSDESNKILVQSLGLSVLSDIVERIVGDVDTVEYTTFTEKFTDLCGGVYASLSIGYPLDGACSNDFEVRELEVTENGVYDVLGYDRIVVSVKSKAILKNGTKLTNSTWTEVPEEYDFSEITDFSYMFANCKATVYPQLDTTKCTNFNHMFSKCAGDIPWFDTSNGTNVAGMFYDCYYLDKIPELDFSSALTMDEVFEACYKITKLHKLNTINATNFYKTFYMCNSLETIEELNLSKCNYQYKAFYSCSKLKNITLVGSINIPFDFREQSKLTYESVKSILTACSNTTNTGSKTIYFTRTLTDQNGELAALVATCNSKGWTVSGLTLQ